MESDQGSIAVSAPVIMIGTLLGRGLGLVGEVAVARLLRPEVFGAIALVYTICLSLGGILTLGINEGVTREMSARIEQKDSIVSSGVSIAVVSAAVGVLVLLALSDPISRVFSFPSFNDYIVYFVPFLLVYPLKQVLLGVLRAEAKSFLAVLCQLSPKVVGLTLLAIAAVLGNPTGGAIAYWTLMPVVALIGAWLSTGWSPLSGFRPGLGEMSRLARFSWPLAISSMIFLAMSNADIIMIGYFLDSSQVGFYRAIQPLQQVTMLFLVSFSFLFLPIATSYFEADQIGELDRFYTTTSKWVAILTLPPVLLFTMFSDGVISTFYGEAYLPAAAALTVLIGGLYTRALVGPNGDLVKATNRSRIELTTSATGMVVNVVANLLLIPRYGMIGAAAGTAVGYMVYTLSESVLAYRETGIQPFQLNTLKPLIVTVIAVGILSQFYSIDGPITLALVAATLSLIQLVAIPLTGSLTVDDVKLAEELAGRAGVSLPSVLHEWTDAE